MGAVRPWQRIPREAVDAWQDPITKVLRNGPAQIKVQTRSNASDNSMGFV